MNSFDNLFEVTTGSVTIKCPEWFQEQGDTEIDVENGKYISFVDLYETLYVVNLDWFTDEKQGELKDQKWILRDIPTLDFDRGYRWIQVGETKCIPYDDYELNKISDKCCDVFRNKEQIMFVTEDSVVTPLKEPTQENIRYSVLYNRRGKIVGFNVDLVPEPNEESDEESDKISSSENACSRCASCSCRR